MAKIKILPPDIRGKIAAGEVILRPVSVVKELIENSLDAQAKRIDVEIEDGGKRKCLVNDDGIGMIREDALLAIERYSTSKIWSIHDIENISTYGFRGEALTSIAQVSYFEIETSDGNQGTKIEVVGAEIKGTFDSHRPKGTRVKVSQLFFNLPARQKFLKSAEWERRLITETIKTYAIIMPHVSFSLVDDSRTLLNLPSVESVEQRIKMLLPKRITECLIHFKRKIGPVTISGLFSRADLLERHHINYIYVNSRPVKYPRLYRTILGAYQNPKNPPIFVLNIMVNPEFVDVNIHPTKNEVKFKDERYIVDILTQVIKKEVFSSKTGADYQHISTDIKQYTIAPQGNRFVQETVIPYTSEEKEKIDTTRDSSEFWQLHNTYILTQIKSGLIIVDQHVAHERIIFESIMKGRHGTQRLLFPITLELTPEEFRAYKRTKEIMRELGIEFKEFSSHTIIIDSLPANAYIDREQIAGLFNEINGLGNLIQEKNEVARIVACRSAIKAGQKLSPEEMQDLIDKLFACENPYTCPHGRPIVLKFTLDDLGARFGRT